MVYRKEIDGLRALAVIPVILFHAGLGVSGGYVGVDIFFVISGYLITSIILRELTAGTFSLIHFYERRIRRILPALFFVIFVCLPFAWLWLLPHELKSFAESVVAVVLFSSNILFWQESEYFATGAEYIPLLHTWSLAVEEQYYVIYPLLMLLLWRFGRYWLVALILLTGLLSLGLSEWGWRYFPEANFYLLPTRAWELMLGALLAFYLFRHKQPGGAIRQWGSLLGILFIVAAVFFFDSDTPFPGFYALVPTTGAALIILFTTEGTLAYWLLSQRLMVGMGLVSYSAYLWHQPLFVFARIRSMDTPSLGLMLALSIATFVLAYLTWLIIERPFRNKRFLARKTLFFIAAIAALLLLGTGVVLIVSEGAMYRFS